MKTDFEILSLGINLEVDLKETPRDPEQTVRWT